jgi:hypothetical protein
MPIPLNCRLRSRVRAAEALLISLAVLEAAYLVGSLLGLV